MQPWRLRSAHAHRLAADRGCPLLGAAVLLLRRPAHRHGGATCSARLLAAASFVIGAVLFFALLGRSGEHAAGDQHLYTWSRSPASRPTSGFQLDQLSMSFVLLITGVGIADPHLLDRLHGARQDRRRFFGYLNLFVAAMLLLVLADNYLLPVRRLGGRRPGVLPADRVLAAQADRGGRGEEGVRGQPGRRHRPVARHHADVRRRSARFAFTERVRRRSARRARARSPRSA